MNDVEMNPFAEGRIGGDPRRPNDPIPSNYSKSKGSFSNEPESDIRVVHIIQEEK